MILSTDDCMIEVCLQAIADILEAKMVDIHARWRSGDLQRHNLNSKEMQSLVCALFEDTDLRRMVLREMSSV